MNELHILLVEDSVSDAELIALWLQSVARFSHSLETVKRLAEAEQKLQTNKFDVALLDLSLPDSDMKRTLAEITTLSQYCPIVVMTGLEDEEIGVQAVRQGAQDYLVKQAINGEVLVRVIRYAIERQRADDAQKANFILQEALRHERELNELKSRFINIVSHEFRTPLSVIMVSTDTLRKYHHRLTEERLQEKLRRIKHSVQHLTTLIENVLLLGKSDSDTLNLNLESFNIDSLLSDIIEQFKELPTTQQEITYKRTENCVLEIVADKDLIRNVITNLISNACKYSAAGTTISISLSCHDQLLYLAIQDEGIGIPATDLPKLFTPFHRAANAKATQGTGIGLVTVKEIVTSHGGNITVDSEVDQGSTFTITLPIDQLQDSGTDEQFSNNRQTE